MAAVSIHSGLYGQVIIRDRVEVKLNTQEDPIHREIDAPNTGGFSNPSILMIEPGRYLLIRAGNLQIRADRGIGNGTFDRPDLEQLNIQVETFETITDYQAGLDTLLWEPFFIRALNAPSSQQFLYFASESEPRRAVISSNHGTISSFNCQVPGINARFLDRRGEISDLLEVERELIFIDYFEEVNGELEEFTKNCGFHEKWALIDFDNFQNLKFDTNAGLKKADLTFSPVGFPESVIEENAAFEVWVMNRPWADTTTSWNVKPQIIPPPPGDGFFSVAQNYTLDEQLSQAIVRVGIAPLLENFITNGDGVHGIALRPAGLNTEEQFLKINTSSNGKTTTAGGDTLFFVMPFIEYQLKNKAPAPTNIIDLGHLPGGTIFSVTYSNPSVPGTPLIQGIPDGNGREVYQKSFVRQESLDPLDVASGPHELNLSLLFTPDNPQERPFIELELSKGDSILTGPEVYINTGDSVKVRPKIIFKDKEAASITDFVFRLSSQIYQGAQYATLSDTSTSSGPSRGDIIGAATEFYFVAADSIPSDTLIASVRSAGELSDLLITGEAADHLPPMPVMSSKNGYSLHTGTFLDQTGTGVVAGTDPDGPDGPGPTGICGIAPQMIGPTIVLGCRDIALVNPRPTLSIELPDSAQVWPHIPAAGARPEFNFGQVEDVMDNILVTSTIGGQPEEDREIVVTTRWIEGSGGHLHNGSQQQSPPDSLMGWIVNIADADSAHTQVQATTNTDGEILLRFRAPQFGGRVAIQAALAIAPGDTVFATDTIAVKVPGLVLLTDGSNYKKVGGTNNHTGPRLDNAHLNFRTPDNNHYAIPAFRDSLISLADAWADSVQSDSAQDNRQTPLNINDISLPNGGLFDISGRWRISHRHHRVGTDADVRTTRKFPLSISERNAVLLSEIIVNGVNLGHRNLVFEQFCIDKRLSTGGRTHGRGANEHYHVYLNIID